MVNGSAGLGSVRVTEDESTTVNPFLRGVGGSFLSAINDPAVAVYASGDSVLLIGRVAAIK